MNFINKIGQRNCANLLLFSTIIFSIVGFIIKHYSEQQVSVSPVPFIQKAILGVILFSTANALLTWSAHANKEYRLVSLFLMTFVAILNTALFFLNQPEYLLPITIGEIIFSIAYLIFVKISETERINRERRSRRKTTSNKTQESTQEPVSLG